MPPETTDALYGPLRLGGSLVGLAIWGAIIWYLFRAAKVFHDERAVNELALAIAGLLGCVAFLVGAIGIVVVQAAQWTRFVNSFVLGFIVYVGYNVLKAVRARHLERGSSWSAKAKETPPG